MIYCPHCSVNVVGLPACPKCGSEAAISYIGPTGELIAKEAIKEYHQSEAVPGSRMNLIKCGACGTPVEIKSDRSYFFGETVRQSEAEPIKEWTSDVFIDTCKKIVDNGVRSIPTASEQPPRWKRHFESIEVCQEFYTKWIRDNMNTIGSELIANRGLPGDRPEAGLQATQKGDHGAGGDFLSVEFEKFNETYMLDWYFAAAPEGKREFHMGLGKYEMRQVIGKLIYALQEPKITPEEIEAAANSHQELVDKEYGSGVNATERDAFKAGAEFILKKLGLG